MATAANSRRTAPTRRRSSRFFKIVVILSGILVAGIFLLFLFSGGYVRGTEFAPATFQTRTFEFRELPILGLQLTPVKRSAPKRVANFISRGKYLPTTMGVPSNWDLVEIERGVSITQAADAKLLIQYIGTGSGGSQQFWRQWSNQHPAAAKVLWPVVQRLAKRELYFLLPDLFDIALKSTRVEETVKAVEIAKQAAATVSSADSVFEDDTSSDADNKKNQASETSDDDDQQAEIDVDDFSENANPAKTKDATKIRITRVDVAELKASIDAYLQSSYLQVAEDMVQAGKPSVAVITLRDAVSDYPQNAAMRDKLTSLEKKFADAGLAVLNEDFSF